MDTPTNSLGYISPNILIIIICLSIIAICLTVLAIHLFRNQYFHNNSYIYNKLIETNKKFLPLFTNVHDISRKYSLSSKSAFDSFNPTKHMIIVSIDCISYISRQIDYGKHNQEIWNKYQKEIQDLKRLPLNATIHTCSYSKTWFIKRSNKCLIQDLLEEPKLKSNVVIYWDYRSPKGRNYYRDEMVYDAESCVRKALESNSKKTFAEEQRSLVTKALRFNVLKRDNYRCIICGASANDGVTLEVDHILPISRGGKTEISNLQTLCHHCNRGKHARMM